MDPDPGRKTGHAEVVVVGVHGTPACDAALEFAIGEALRRGVGVEIVTAWQATDIASAGTELEARREARRRALTAQRQAMGNLHAHMGSEVPTVSGVLAEGDAEDVLTLVSQHAVCVVIGTHHAEPAPVGARVPHGLSLPNSRCPVVRVPVPVQHSGAGLGG
jgi:hypothetical protein